jgi:branched-chain amino acid transport system permease protein
VWFFLALLVDGALAGVLYALIALAFVVVYKSSRMINFALGEWMMLGSRLVAMGLQPLGLGLAGAVAWACAGMVACALVFNRVVLCRLVGRPLISLLMITLGLGALMRGASALAFQSIPATMQLPIPREPLVVGGLLVPMDKLVTAAVATVAIAVVACLFHGTRMGVALRAVADDQQAAMAVGIDLQRYFSITWAMVGVLSVLGGTLWTVASGSGFGVVLLGLKIFPIVIIGGLDSLPGTIVAAVLVGVLESLAAGYLDPLLGGGFGNVASDLGLIAMLFVRPYGLLGHPLVERI